MKKIKILIGVIALGAVVGIVVYLLQPVSYRAYTVIRLSSYVNDSNLEVPFESIMLSSARLKSRVYLNEALKYSKNYQETKKILLNDSLTIKSLSSKDEPSAIEVSITNQNQRAALDAIASVGEQLKATHDFYISQYKLKENIQLDLIKNSKFEDIIKVRAELKNRIEGCKSLEFIVPASVERKVIFSSFLRAILFGILLCCFIYLIRIKLINND